jgi:hypothetical protein
VEINFLRNICRIKFLELYVGLFKGETGYIYEKIKILQELFSNINIDIDVYVFSLAKSFSVSRAKGQI